MDDFIFDAGLNRFFKSDSGAGSRITEKDEATKRQLTVAKHERDLLLKYHPILPIGSLAEAEKRGEQTSFSFRKFPTGYAVRLNIHYPDATKDALQLHLTQGEFSPRVGDMWFLFERQNQIWIGSFEDAELNAARRNAPFDMQNGFDHGAEEAYQAAINGHAPDLPAAKTI
ncbi:hypothetical protein [Pseudorhodobacter ferrugineus]|uniref:hypothetical protein n=1 Tax=Pseudorhodobacter ferrugineus TaxID=77008 RepID=UPI0003B79594|nr:hypothetical protein [Pseudorhodobacter ferrugineus]